MAIEDYAQLKDKMEPYQSPWKKLKLDVVMIKIMIACYWTSKIACWRPT